MVASYFFLKERINLIQGVGATCILVGASVSFLPALLHPTAGTSTTTGILIFVASLLPSASSNVYKEACFRSKTDEMAVDVNLLSAIVAIFQVLIGFCFMPILAMPAFGGLPFNEMPNQMKLGFQCFLGQGTRTFEHHDRLRFLNPTAYPLAKPGAVLILLSSCAQIRSLATIAPA